MDVPFAKHDTRQYALVVLAGILVRRVIVFLGREAHISEHLLKPLTGSDIVK